MQPEDSTHLASMLEARLPQPSYGRFFLLRHADTGRIKLILSTTTPHAVNSIPFLDIPHPSSSFPASFLTGYDLFAYEFRRTGQVNSLAFPAEVRMPEFVERLWTEMKPSMREGWEDKARQLREDRERTLEDSQEMEKMEDGIRRRIFQMSPHRSLSKHY